MVHRVEIFKEAGLIVVLQSLKVSHLSNIPNRFYESPNLKNWMCELCMFSQIRSQILTIQLPMSLLEVCMHNDLTLLKMLFDIMNYQHLTYVRTYIIGTSIK